MKITGITAQQKDPNRVNIMIDGKYRFSLDISQVINLGVKIGREYSESELAEVEGESQFGKLYGRALEYCLMRPHSAREVRDYLWRKTRTTKYKTRTTGEIKEREGVAPELTERVYEKLVEKSYIDDDSFARFWIENRNLTKGTSRRKLEAELRAKGVSQEIVARHLEETGRTDDDELRKVIAKKRSRYTDDQKLMQYLARQGFGYEDIKRALSDDRI
ncbi:RecX family transcriptional regulator [Candidatus Saccharibacteria bacterium]|nr:RecX family transcriptional regulator [Candidatus Saccharibacteria bacterium]